MSTAGGNCSCYSVYGVVVRDFRGVYVCGASRWSEEKRERSRGVNDMIF